MDKKESIFIKPLSKAAFGEKVYSLTDQDVADILRLRGMKTELDPGMGGVSPKVISDLLESSSELVSVDIAMTAACNFKCIWCYRPGEEWGRLIIDFDTILKIIEDAKKLGVRFFVLTGGEPTMYSFKGKDYFDVVDMIREIYAGEDVNILTFSDVAMITRDRAEKLAERKVGLCLKRDTLDNQIQDIIVGAEYGIKGGGAKMAAGYENLFAAGYGTNPDLPVTVNSVLAKDIPSKKGRMVDTLKGAIDLHVWVRKNGMEHSIVPIHYCGEAIDGKQDKGINPLHVKALYDILAQIDLLQFNDPWRVYSAFPKNKTCNRPGRGIHIRATGAVTSCSESPLIDAYVFGNVYENSLASMIRSQKFQDFRQEFSERSGEYICNPDVCDLNANLLCRGGCATRSAYSRIDPQTGLIVQNTKMEAYSRGREDPLCPGWIVLAKKQGILKPGLYEAEVDRLLAESSIEKEFANQIREKVVDEFNSLEA